MQVYKKKNIYKIKIKFHEINKGSLTTTVEKVEGGYMLNGWKKFITNAGIIILINK